MPTYRLALLITALVAACGDDGGSPAPIDAAVVDAAGSDATTTDAAVDAQPVDARPSSVLVVPCAGAQIASDVTTVGFSFAITNPTIGVGAVVRFTMPGIHNAVSGTVTGGLPTPDGNFRVDFGQTACLRFTADGNFPFYCGVHLFTGALTVTP